VKTQTGTMVGTPHYMAPEYVHGGKKFDHRIDVYSLGVIAFEMLAGVLPFQGDGVGQILVAHMLEPVPPLRPLAPAVGPELEAVVMRALEKDPAARFQTAEEMARALLAAVGDGTVTAPVARGAAPAGAAGRAVLSPAAVAPRAPVPAAATPTRALLPPEAGGGGDPTGEHAEPTDLPSESTTVGPPRAPFESLPTVIKAVPTAPEPPSTLSVTAAEIQRAAPTLAGRRSWALVGGLAAAALVAGTATVVVLSVGGTSDEATSAGHHEAAAGEGASDEPAAKKHTAARDGDDATTAPAEHSSAPSTAAEPVADARTPAPAAATAAAEGHKKGPKKPAGLRKPASAAAAHTAAPKKDVKKPGTKPGTKTAELDLAD
jgi:serine/threonine-protein kinase